MKKNRVFLTSLIFVIILLVGCDLSIFSTSSSSENSSDEISIELISPENSSINLEIPVVIEWSSDGTSFDIYCDENSSPTTKKNIISITENEYFLDDLEAGTTYYWQVVAQKLGEADKSSSIYNFTTAEVVITDTIDSLVLSYPTDNSTNLDIPVGLEWTSDGTSFDIYCDENSSPTTKINSSPITDKEYSLSNLAVGTTYYWRVVAKKDGADNKSSEIYSFSTINVDTSDIFTETSNQVFYIQNGSETEFTYNLDLGESTKDVYFIITNSDLNSDISGEVSITSKTLSSESFTSTQTTNKNTFASSSLNHKNIIKDYPQASLFNNKKHNFRMKSKSSQLKSIIQSKNSVNDTKTFYTEMDNSNQPTESTPATLRSVVSNITTIYGDKSLLIWVADDSWTDGGTKAKLVTQQMVDVMAEKFLMSDLNNDIYDWISNIYGQEWGDSDFNDLIGETDEISILLYDIEDDNSTDGGVVGYFWAKDNYLKSEIPASNEKIMFYIDAVMYAVPDGDIWEISDDWPSEMISTLAHEFQHMISFYQKDVLNSPQSPGAWLNELSSMAAEDFVANKMQADGPRGVAYSDSTSGDNNNSSGRIPEFNSYNYISVTDWGNGELKNYSIDYSFGAYLARNFGGVELFGEILQNEYSEEEALTKAVESGGYGTYSLGDILQKWGAAVLLSDNTSSYGEYHKLNSGGWFESSTNNIDYTIGSINHFNFIFNSQVGPKIYDLTSDNLSNTFYKTSNRYFLAGENLTGLHSFDIILPDTDLKLTVVVK